MMTRKDSIAIAEAFRTVRNVDGCLLSLTATGEHADGARLALEALQGEISDVFAAYNPRFDRERFYAACEVIA